MTQPRRPADADERRPADDNDTPNAARSDADREVDREEDDNVLESIGKAVSAPVRGAADPDSDEKPRRREGS